MRCDSYASKLLLDSLNAPKIIEDETHGLGKPYSMEFVEKGFLIVYKFPDGFNGELKGEMKGDNI